VLDKEDDRLLVISKYALDCKQYNDYKQYNDSFSDAMWEKCILREWLNDKFIDFAFTENEKAMIPTVTVYAEDNQYYGTDAGNSTQDKVFLLSISEAEKYFEADSERRCEPTAYAIDNGAYIGIGGNCLWWLRSPGRCKDEVASVQDDIESSILSDMVTYENHAVRPALWINLKS